ncbi:MAG: TlyA family RNA methyltransferase [bacterium]
MRLDTYLVQRHNYSRSRAQLLIDDGSVLINGVVATKANKTVQLNDHVAVTDTIKFVSRAGLKLAYALEAFTINASNKICLDIGSSTGGFTDCLLQQSALHVDAVDVGTDQLVDVLRLNPRVSVYEQTDIRVFNNSQRYDLIVCDASFISLLKIIPELPRFSKEFTEVLLLIKPQFEVGKEYLGKGGIVNDEMRVVEVITDIVTAAQTLGYRINNEVKLCPIKGGDGNQEYIACFTYVKKSV